MNTGNVILILQARSGSTRLPGKVLRDVLTGRTMLDLMIERLREARRIDQIVVASPEGEPDDRVASVASNAGVGVFRGPEDDVRDEAGGDETVDVHVFGNHGTNALVVRWYRR